MKSINAPNISHILAGEVAVNQCHGVSASKKLVLRKVSREFCKLGLELVVNDEDTELGSVAESLPFFHGIFENLGIDVLLELGKSIAISGDKQICAHTQSLS